MEKIFSKVKLAKGEEAIADDDALNFKDFKIGDDIYTLAVAALIDPKMANPEGKKGYIENVPMSPRDMTKIYMGGTMVTLIQVTMIFLIATEMQSEGFTLAPADKFTIIVPRLLSSIMMHLNVEPDIRNGLLLMKYVVNHPTHIKYSMDADKNMEREVGNIHTMNVFFAFFMGFAQTVIAVVVEIFVIIYLSSLTSIIDIIRKFVTLAVIVRFDNMYSAALFESKMKKVVGQKLKFSYKRHMGQSSDGTGQDREALDWEKRALIETEDVATLQNPRKGRYCLQAMRFVQKFWRMYYVSLNYYFMPYLAVVVTFVSQQTKRH